MTLEQCSMINISRLQKAIRKNIDVNYPDSNDEEIKSITESELDKFTANGQKFEYASIENVLGGHRWFFLCPKCKNRVSKLWLPPEGATKYEHKYFCRYCHNIKNQSTVMGQSKVYKKVIRPLKRMKEIEAKLERGYLKTDYVEKLLDEYDALEKEAKSCPEYRIYAFKKRMGKI